MRHLTILLLFLPSFSGAQNRAVWFENIGMEAGLSHQNVTALCRDHRGFLWIGTNGGGLNRYDGYDIKVYRHNDHDSTSLCNDAIAPASIFEDKDGYLWIGTDGGISRFNPANGRCQNFTRQNGRLVGNFDNRLFMDSQGNIYTGNSHGIERFEVGQQRFVLVPGSPEAFGMGKSAFDASGKLWCGGNNGLKLYNPINGTFQKYLPFPDAPSRFHREQNFIGVITDKHGNIWCTTWGAGLLRYHPRQGKFEQFTWTNNPEYPNHHNIPKDLAETYDAEGRRNLWIAVEHGLFKFPMLPDDFPDLSKSHEFFNCLSKTGSTMGCPSVLLADKEGNLWEGSEDHGLFRYHTRQENFQVVENVKAGDVQQIVFCKNGDVLLSGLTDPLTVLDAQLRMKKNFHAFHPGMHPTEGRVSWAVTKDEGSGTIHAGTFDGLVSYSEKRGKLRWFPYKTDDTTGLLGQKISNMFPLGNDRLLLSFWKGGVQVFDARTGKNIKVVVNNNLIVRQIKKTADGNIWICAENHLYLFDAVKMAVVEVTPVNDCAYWSAFSDVQGRTWLATNHGLMLFEVASRRVIAKYGANEGLPNHMVKQLCGDELGRLWLLTDLGLCCFDPKTKQGHTLSQVDGLVFGKYPHKMEQGPDGRIWLTFQNNLQIFKPELVRSNDIPRVYITGLKINEKDTLPEVPFEKIREIRLQPGENALTFEFAAIDFESFGTTNFLYLLEGLQSAWTKAGKNRRAAFVNLPAGTYTFRVKPESAGDQAAFDATLKIIVTNHVWERVWFRYSAVMLVSTMLFGLFLYGHTRQLKMNNLALQSRLALQEERDRIARDLHDDLGSGLGAIGLLSDIALSRPMDGELGQIVGKITETAHDLSEKVHDIIWAANIKNDSVEKLAGYLHRYASMLFEGSDVELLVHLPDHIPECSIPGNSRRNFFLAFKEALNNVFKHSGATQVQLVFECTDKQLSLYLKDNGHGFNLEKEYEQGNGLGNMRRRMEAIGGVFDIQSDIHGTTVNLKLIW